MSEQEKLQQENDELKKENAELKEKLGKAWSVIRRLEDKIMGLKMDRNRSNYPGHLTPPNASSEDIPSEDSY